jgi:hypothetical protein
MDVLLVDAGHQLVGLEGNLHLAALVRLDCFSALALDQARCLSDLLEYMAQSSMSSEGYVGVCVTKVTD